jgi:transposase
MLRCGSGERSLPVSDLFAEAENLARAVAVAKRLDQRLRREGKEPLETILDDAADTSLATFAANLRRDLDAVQPRWTRR